MATEVVMPQMGESIAEGTITKWLKNVGDHVDRDEPLFEISTDKVDAEIPSPAAGTLTEVRYKEGETVEVNTVVAVLDGDGSTAPPAKEESSAVPDSPAEAPAAPPAKAEAAASSIETVQAETAAAPPEPAKPEPPTTVERPKPVITSAPTSHKTEVKTLVKKSEPAIAKVAPPPPRSEDGASAADLRRTKSSPLVRKIAEEHNIDIKQLEGTGMSGRVTKNDILSFIESGSAAPTAAAAPLKAQPAPAAAAPAPPAPAMKSAQGDRVEQMSVMRKKIAEHMVLSRRTSAHVSTVYDIDMTKIAKIRDENREAFLERTGTKLTFM